METPKGRRKGNRTKYSYQFKVMVALAYIEGTEPTSEIAKRFGLPSRTMVNNMYLWYKKNCPNEENLPVLDDVPASTQVQKRLQKAEELLEAERIKSAALEKLIEIAERELKIEIRKK